MLETLDLSNKLPKAEYKKRIHSLQGRLLRLQRACWEKGIGTMVVFEGWDTAGKSSTIRKLTRRLEPRGFSLHPIREPRTFERQMPWMWRFWLKVPNGGEIAIFDRSWYGRVLVARVENMIDRDQWRAAYDDICAFERALAADRYLIVKFFLHISKSDQEKRFQQLETRQHTSWSVEPEDWEHHRLYEEYLVAFEDMLIKTNTSFGPWTQVAATDRRWARVKVFETLIDRMEDGLSSRGVELPEPVGDSLQTKRRQK